MGAPDRYDPLPALTDLPAWVWRRTSRAARVAIALAIVALIAAVAIAAPRIADSRREADARAARERAREHAELKRKLEAEQRPILRTGPHARAGAGRAAQLDARARLMRAIEGAILADVRTRVRRGELEGSVRRVECEPFPRSPGAVGADRDLARARGRYSCLAVTAEFDAGALGHQYRVRADFRAGRYGFCKITGRAGPEREQIVTIPAACGGESHDGRNG